MFKTITVALVTIASMSTAQGRGRENLDPSVLANLNCSGTSIDGNSSINLSAVDLGNGKTGLKARISNASIPPNDLYFAPSRIIHSVMAGIEVTADSIMADENLSDTEKGLKFQMEALRGGAASLTLTPRRHSELAQTFQLQCTN